MKPKCILYIRPDNTAIICAWCQSKDKEGDIWAEANGKEISHGMCESHKQKMLDDLPIESLLPRSTNITVEITETELLKKLNNE